MRWDREVDVIVVGAGAGGMSAALTAHIEGLSVLLIERTEHIGGSTAISGGVIWAPVNTQATALGLPDSVEQAMRYLAATVGNTTPTSLQRSFVDACAHMLTYFERHTALQFAARAQAPDYYPNKPGATLGGRAMDPREFDGRGLGKHFKTLRDPLPEFTVLGGMMVNTQDAKQLLALGRSVSAWRHGVPLVLRYLLDRLRGYHRGTRLVLGNALAGRLFRSILERKIEYWLQAQVQALQLEAGAVHGLVVTHQGQQLNIRARRGVVVATGGFPWHTGMREQWFPKPSGPWSMSPASNQGEGIELAQEAGATLGKGHAGAGLWAPVSIQHRADGTVVRYPHLVWDRAKPGLMAVNRRGDRFVNEATTYHEFVLAMYREHEQTPSIPAFLVCDHDFIQKWGLGLALPGGRARQHLLRDGYLKSAPTLPALALLLGMPQSRLEATAAQFNAAAQSGTDAAWGKGSNAYNRYLGDPDHLPNPCLGPLRQGPFYAIEVYPGDIGTALGIQCNAHGQALNAQGQAIPGLYMAGNDMHSIMGGHYPSAGITLGPALTFGWLAGQHLAHGDKPPLNA